MGIHELMVTEKELAEIAGGNKKNYIERKNALLQIKNKFILNKLALTAKDNWIRLEAAVLCKNQKVLKELTMQADLSLSLEAALRLHDQEILANIAIKSNEYKISKKALSHIKDKKMLRKVIIDGRNEKIRTETAIKLKDILIMKELSDDIEDEQLKFQLAIASVNIEQIIYLIKNAKEISLRVKAHEWLQWLNPKIGKDID